MIEMTAAAEELSRPAKNLKELAERLSLHIGETLSVESSEGARNYRQIARLEGIELETYSYGEELTYILSGFEDEEDAELGFSYRVLIDGKWKTIHEPKRKKDQR